MAIAKYLSLIGIIFFYLFNFTISPLKITGTGLVLACCFAALILDRRLIEFISRLLATNSILITLLFSVAAVGSWLSALWGAGELILLEIFIKNLIILFEASILSFYIKKYINYNYKNNFSLDLYLILDLCFYALSLQAFFVLISFINPSIRDFFSAITINKGNIDIDHPFRFRGLHDSGGFNLSAFLGIGFIYSMFSFLRINDQHMLKKVAMTFISIILFVSVALVGRTGFVVIGIGFFLLAIRWPINTVRMALYGIAIGAIMFIIAQLIFIEKFNYFNATIFNYAFELFLNAQDGQGFRTDSSDDLKSMLFIPNFFNIVFGSGSFDTTYAGVPRSDSGYLKTLLAYGAFGFIAIYGSYFFIALKILYKKKINEDLIYFLYIVIAILILIEIKGPVFYQNDISRFIWLIYGTLMANQFASTDKMPRNI
jgi:hypothetical protein